MLRRVHTPHLLTGQIVLDCEQAHHLRDVLRLSQGTSVEVFDNAGLTAAGVIVACDASGVVVHVDEVRAVSPTERVKWTIASAVPKGERADWMVEKLSELGTARFIPLTTARSVVHPRGRGKHDRWMRLATESARQSRRAGVMQIWGLTDVNDLVAELNHQTGRTGWYLSTELAVTPIADAITRVTGTPHLTLLIGPEGGWSPDEIESFREANLTAVGLTATILRVETASVAAASVLAVMSAASRGEIS